MSYTFSDVYGFAGAFSLGMVQSGFQMKAKRETSTFGFNPTLANRHLLGYDWEPQQAASSRWPDWDIVDTDVVAGNPPCSGFSPLSSREYRGMDSAANECMWAFESYVARAKPQIAVFESVAQAYTQGRELMVALRDKLEADTGLEYNLYHIRHNGLGVGGAAIRARYFWCVSQIPFGVELVETPRVPSVLDSIGDLRGLDMQWEPQDYIANESWWSGSRRNPEGTVDGHITRQSIHTDRMNDVLSNIYWEPGKDESWAIKEMHDKIGHLPESFENISKRIYDRDFHVGFNGTYRWRPTRPAYVVTGDAANKIIHPTEPRLLTYREIFRVQGFPDTWKLEELRDDSKIGQYPGKGIPVDCGRWMGGWIKNALDGNPGSYSGEEIGEREFLIDAGKDHKAALARLLEETESL